MNYLQNEMQEGALSQMLKDAIANINYKGETELLIKNQNNEKFI